MGAVRIRHGVWPAGHSSRQSFRANPTIPGDRPVARRVLLASSAAAPGKHGRTPMMVRARALAWVLPVIASGCLVDLSDTDDTPRLPPPAVPNHRVVRAAEAPPPISGGTLLVTSDQERAVAADPDRDAIWVVELYD